MNQVMERTSFKSVSPTPLLNLGCPDIPPHVIMLWNASEAKQSTSQLKRIPGDPLNSPQFSVKDIECFWQSIQKLITHLSEVLFQLWELHKYNIILQIKPSVPLETGMMLRSFEADPLTNTRQNYRLYPLVNIAS